jgi:hypothetical protein
MMAHGSFTKIHDSFTKKLHKTFMKASTKQERLTQAQPEKKESIYMPVDVDPFF